MKMLNAEDLLIEILLGLPPRSLLRLQCVSKQWLSIISNPKFRRLHSRRSASVVTGLFYPPPMQIPFPAVPQLPQLVSLPPNEKRQHITIENRLIEVCDGRFVVSLSSSNGLLCIGLSDENVLFLKSQYYYVYNPTTNQRSSRIPGVESEGKYVSTVAIAFDPSKSNHYKLVCVCEHCLVWVFSSESRVWRNTGTRVPMSLGLGFYSTCNPYLNGAIHWYLYKNEFVCFDIDSCELRPMPCISCVNNDPGGCKYLGECGGHLHFVGRHEQLLNVFEMQNDYSQWVFKYRVDLGYVARFYPPMDRDSDWYRFCINLLLTGGDEEEGEGEGLVILLPNGKVILWRLHDMSITQLVESCNEIQPNSYRGYFTSKHIHTLAFVH